MQSANRRERHYVTVAGNIGVGKSTLVQLLAEQFGWEPYFEIAEEHPYLSDYYADRARWGFHSQVWFLAQRHEQHQAIAASPHSVCQDRSIYEDYEVFVKSLYEQGILSQRDFQTYQKLFVTLVRRLRPPTLLIYLQASVPNLQRRIGGRARGYEQEIPASYLQGLDQRYTEWLSRFTECPVVSINTNELDFARSAAAQREIINQIATQIGA
ncbi:deoxynucleoside kinase [Candidatus Gracilibacteria bacterium]|nr:deoxynucleoside kinase [Candidatus Gracilibacteria bacterium]